MFLIIELQSCGKTLVKHIAKCFVARFYARLRDWFENSYLQDFDRVAPRCPPPSSVAQSVAGGGVDVRSRSFVRSLSSPRQPKRLGGTSRNVVVFLLVPLRHT